MSPNKGHFSKVVRLKIKQDDQYVRYEASLRRLLKECETKSKKTIKKQLSIENIVIGRICTQTVPNIVLQRINGRRYFT